MQTRSSACYGVSLILLTLSLLAAASMPIGTTAASPAPEATTIDWSRGEAQITNANCGALSFTNMKDHHEYTLWLKGQTSATCSFKADGLSFHLPPNFGPTDTGTTTLFSFKRFGPDVLVSWIPGY